MYETFDDNLPESREFELGFYRGRGGSKTSILDEEDMTSMYEYYSNPAQEISLYWYISKQTCIPTDTVHNTTTATAQPV